MRFRDGFRRRCGKIRNWQLNSWRDYGFVNYRCKYNRSGEHLYGKFYNSGDVVGVLLDMDHGTISYTKLGHGMNLGRQALVNMGVADTHIRSGRGAGGSTRWRRSCTLYPCVGFAQAGNRATLVGCRWVSLPGQRPKALLANVWRAASLLRRWAPPPCIPRGDPRHNAENRAAPSAPTFVPASGPRVSRATAEDAYARWRSWVGQRWKRHTTLAGAHVSVDTDPSRCLALSGGALRVGDRVRIPRADAVVLGVFRGCVWYRAVQSVPALAHGEDRAWYWTPSQIRRALAEGAIQPLNERGETAREEASREAAERSAATDPPEPAGPGPRAGVRARPPPPGRRGPRRRRGRPSRPPRPRGTRPGPGPAPASGRARPRSILPRARAGGRSPRGFRPVDGPGRRRARVCRERRLQRGGRGADGLSLGFLPGPRGAGETPAAAVKTPRGGRVGRARAVSAARGGGRARFALLLTLNELGLALPLVDLSGAPVGRAARKENDAPDARRTASSGGVRCFAPSPAP